MLLSSDMDDTQKLSFLWFLHITLLFVSAFWVINIFVVLQEALVSLRLENVFSFLVYNVNCGHS